jgi:hypothetical protein
MCYFLLMTLKNGTISLQHSDVITKCDIFVVAHTEGTFAEVAHADRFRVILCFLYYALKLRI